MPNQNKESSRKREIVVDGFKLTFRQSGKGEVLVLIHTDHLFAKHLAQTMADQHTIITLDTPGYYSQKQSQPVTDLTTLIKIMDRLFQNLKFSKVSLFGQCLGSIIALNYAAAYPKRVHKLVLVSLPFIYFKKIYAKPIRTGFSFLKKNRFASKTAAFMIKQRSIQEVAAIFGGYKSIAKALTQESALAHPDFDHRVFFGILNDALNTDLIKTASQITCPTLFIAGGKDPLGSTSELKKISRKITKSSVHLIKGAKHAVVQNNQKEVKENLLAFLRPSSDPKGPLIQKAAA